MESRALIFVLLIEFVLLGSARAELQLVPRATSYILDGVQFSQLAFPDGNKEVTYAPPAHWTYTGGSKQLTLRPPEKPQAEAIILKTVNTEAANFDENTMKKLVDQTVAAMPEGSTNVKVVSEQKNPLLIDRKETFMVICNYALANQDYSRSILFLNRGNEQIRFQLTCRRSDFESLQKAFLTSQYSWQNL